MSGKHTLRLRINGAWHDLPAAPPHRSLLHLLRGLGLVGAKEGCAEGECGACAVAMVNPDAGDPERSRIRAVNSCLVPAGACSGSEIWTVEGVGTPAALHPTQKAMVETSGSQCGYCTPGFVVAMAAALADRGAVESHDIAGNLCRCTGYRPILDAVERIDSAPAEDPMTLRRAARPPLPTPGTVATAAGETIRPAGLGEALGYLLDHPNATVLAGGTDLMVEANLAGRRFDHLLAVDDLAELRSFQVTPRSLRIGAGLRLAEVAELAPDEAPLLSRLWPLFASGLIRNRATLGGNLATASPIGDAAPALLALDAELELASLDREAAIVTRTIPLHSFFVDYRRTELRPGELITSILVPLPVVPHSHFEKFAKRREDDISTVAFAGTLALEGATIAAIRLAFGGVAATPKRALTTEVALVGLPPREAAARVAELLREELQPLSDHRGSARYRLAMAIAGATRLISAVDTPTGARA